MFSIEGKIKYGTDTNALIGNWGLRFAVKREHADFIADTESVHFTRYSAVGNKKNIEQLAQKIHEEQKVPLELIKIGVIQTQEQAAHFPTIAREEEFGFQERRVPKKFSEYLSDNIIVPYGQKLLTGTGMLWQEKPYPALVLPVWTRGKLIEENIYNEQNGWHNPNFKIEGRRIKNYENKIIRQSIKRKKII